MRTINQKFSDSTEFCSQICSEFNSELYDVINYETKKYSEDVLGFLADHVSLVVTYKSKKSGQITRKRFFVKLIPQSNENLSEYVETCGVFHKELALYGELIPSLLKLSHKAFAPNCFLVGGDFIVLEDLSTRGYKVANSPYLSFEKMTSLLKTVAAMHAASITLEERRSTSEKKYRLIDHYQRELKETSFSFIKGEPRQKWAVTCWKCISDCIRQQKVYEDIEGRHEKLKNIILVEMQKYIRPSKKFRNVLIHDDLWSNNVMFNKMGEAVIVDFQMARYVPPAYDVLMALYLNLKNQLLLKEFDTLINVYYTSLSMELSLHNIDIKNICNKKEFDKSIEFYRLPALIESVMYGTIIYISQELSSRILSDLDTFTDFVLENRRKYVTREYLEREEFRNRFNEVLYPLIEILDNINNDCVQCS